MNTFFGPWARTSSANGALAKASASDCGSLLAATMSMSPADGLLHATQGAGDLDPLGSGVRADELEQAFT
jgi:hypothetical protein